MKDQLNRIEKKIDKCDERLDQVDITLERNTVSLEDHMRRTEILEKKVEPLERQSAESRGQIKLVRWIGIIAGSILSIIALLKIFSPFLEKLI